MIKRTISIPIVIITSLLLISPTTAQYANKKVKDKYQIYTDSIKSINYDRVFPILGAKAYKKGIDLQYPFGVMVNSFWIWQDISITNFKLGVENADSNGLVDFPTTPVGDSIISFGLSTNSSFSFNVRPDLWVLPFLDIYGIFGYGTSLTTIEVNFMQYSNNPENFTSVVEQGLTTYGFGALVAGGIGPVWLSIDANVSWNKPELLEDPTLVNVVGLRLGKAFTFKKRPQSNISIWGGAMFVKMQSETVGSIKLKDALPQEVWDRKTEIVENYEYWLEHEATPAQKLVATKYISPIVNELASSNGESTIHYAMDKQVKQHWNGIIGMQYQINKSWQIRAEGGIIGNRKSILVSANYRFLGFKKKAKKSDG